MKKMARIALVTGAGNGIGREIARKFAAEGVSVIIADRDAAAGSAALAELATGLHAFVECDLAQPAAIDHLFKTIAEEYGALDLLVNNAGLSRFASLAEATLEAWDEILAVNLRAPFLCAQRFARLNQGRSHGRIVNIASTRALQSEPGNEAYSASKGGLISLTHALANSLAGTGITVNAIAPGWISTTGTAGLRPSDHAQHPCGRVGIPADIASLAWFLCQPENGFLTGETIVCDGGMTRKMIYEP